MYPVTNFERVREFHRAFSVEENASPSVLLPMKTQYLRWKLMLEELDELKEAVFQSDAEGVLKELCDLLYVVYGYGAVMGFDVDAAFALVHASNMTKLGVDGKPTYRDDGKVMKSPQYTPPDLRGLL